ncbi:integrase domain-containing protein [Pectobacterium polonicum]|uniref:integrase domain-containing protein n=1 Tax=Pectobacterium polonicum TaxID=2485124 RepID=UPI0010F6CD43|nr:integrase domain-containing protein [Pectobacterium polonicum]TKY84033.1 DNA-binding protein [Pectobacterium polonicum]
MAKLNKNLVTLARDGGGSFKTLNDRMKIANRFAERLKRLNVQIRDAKNIKPRHIEMYIRSRQEEKISIRTLQNEMSAIRSILRAAGKTIMANPENEKLSNQALGISGASRDGSKVAIPDNVYQSILEKVSAADKGAAAAMELSRLLGLRTEETIQSVKSLKTWQKALQNGNEKVRIVYGTKGGRPRDTTIIEREKLINAVNNAIHITSENNGRLINRPALHLAIEQYRNIVREAGLVGKYAPHSLRYVYTQDATKLHLKNGFSKEEADALVSMDLGHGDGRGRYVARVYNKVDPTQ